MNEKEKKAIKYFYNLRSTIDESYMLFDEEINLKCGKEMIKQITLILNLITKLQKEKEDLLREKEENKFIIAMANNEMLGYNQGYSDAENKNSNATEIVIKNRQAYIHKEEVELYKRKIDFLQKENEELKTITKTYDTLKNTQENIVIADKKFFDKGYFNENLIPISFIKEMQEKLMKKLKCDNNIRIYTLRDSYMLQHSILDELIDCYLDKKVK